MNLHDKTVLVTGGTGSFGRMLTRIALRNHAPRKLIIFSRDELKQFDMRHEFEDDPRLRFFIGDVRDRERLMRAFDGVDAVIHAAALKQVPAAEYNPFEAIKTNVFGAQNVIEAAIERNVRRVVALSTDKAANPINLYGATKLCSDKLFIAGNSYSGAEGTRFSVVRYGNVIGSRGSVVPFFLKQKEHGFLPITDPRMTRFWITLEQGALFVLKSLRRMRGGELYVPKIPSMNVVDLAKAIAPECEVHVVGIRPGEKLHESLIGEDDARRALEFDDYYVLEPAFPWWGKLRPENGRALPDGFSYRSDNNPWRLTVEELRKLAEKL